MLNMRLWDEWGPKWPKGYWDDWLREPAQRKTNTTNYTAYNTTNYTA